jgi:hypothetical protein
MAGPYSASLRLNVIERETQREGTHIIHRSVTGVEFTDPVKCIYL